MAETTECPSSPHVSQLGFTLYIYLNKKHMFILEWFSSRVPICSTLLAFRSTLETCQIVFGKGMRVRLQLGAGQPKKGTLERSTHTHKHTNRDTAHIQSFLYCTNQNHDHSPKPPVAIGQKREAPLVG